MRGGQAVEYAMTAMPGSLCTAGLHLAKTPTLMAKHLAKTPTLMAKHLAKTPTLMAKHLAKPPTLKATCHLVDLTGIHSRCVNICAGQCNTWCEVPGIIIRRPVQRGQMKMKGPLVVLMHLLSL